MKYFLSFFFFLLLVSANWSCSRQSLSVAKPRYTTNDRYDTSPPAYGVSAALNKMAQSVYRLNVIAFYESYIFDKSAHITLDDFKRGKAERYAISRSVSNQSVLGTATVVYADHDKAALLTCAHVVNFPDTVVTYFPDSSGIISNIAIKLKQMSYAAGLNSPNVKLLATDDKHDIAILMATIQPEEDVRVMPFPTGKSAALSWGTFVYVMGFPKGHKMVENGIVSKPDNNKTGFFLTNAIFNRGISGGPVFAVRNGTSHFEWVGIASSASVSTFFYLKPNIDIADTYSQSTSYKGELLINKKRMINYGVTFSVPMKEIVKFVLRIKPELEKHGFAIKQFFYH